MPNSKIYNTLIYPYTINFASFIAPWTSQLRKNIMIKAVVTPEVLGLSDKDAGNVDNREAIGINVGSDFKEALKVCDTFLAAEGKHIKELRDDIVEKMHFSIESKKNIICTISLSKDELDIFITKAKQYGVDFIYTKEKADDKALVLPGRLFTPSASVIFVGEIMSGLNGFDIVVSLTDYYKKIGYKVSTLAVPEYSKLFGFHVYSELEVYSQFDEHEKITYYNSFFNAIEKKEKPDIIIVQLLGGMVRYNDIIKNEYGIYSYMMAHALTPDCFVLCVPYKSVDGEKLQELNTMFKYRYGFNINCIHQSNVLVDIGSSNNSYRLEWSYVPLSVIDQYIPSQYAPHKDSISVYNGLKASGRNQICKHTHDILQSYADAVAL